MSEFCVGWPQAPGLLFGECNGFDLVLVLVLVRNEGPCGFKPQCWAPMLENEDDDEVCDSLLL